MPEPATTLLNVASGRVVPVGIFYKVTEFLGNGRYSEVYKAFDTHNHVDVALKLYVAFDEEAHQRATREQGILTRLGQFNSEYFPKFRRGTKHRIENRYHPVLVLELGTYVGSDNQKKIIRLQDVIPEGPVSVVTRQPDEEFWTAEHIVQWLTDMVQAVKQLHEAQIVHRDIKPANILLKRGPGQSSAVPLFLDFNSAAASAGSDSKSGTRRYLPPEVNLGRREIPSIDDDLWAIALVGWEVLHGQGSSPEQPCSAHPFITGVIPPAVEAVFRRALSISREDRFASAVDMLHALETACSAEVVSAATLSSDDASHARGEMDRIRRAINRDLAPPGDIVVPKEVEDSVTTVIAWLSEQDTQSLSLVDELVAIGPAAIPVCLQQGYRLQPATSSYRDIVTAISKLAVEDTLLAQRSIDAYALSANTGVRALCWTACEVIEYFPDGLLESLMKDEGVLFPEERLKVADLCIRFCRKSTAVLALVKYICREYILDHNQYRTLCLTVAGRMSQLQISEDSSVAELWSRRRDVIIALLIAQDCEKRVWEQLDEFKKLPQGNVATVEKGLLELLAEAFAATGLGALEILKAGKVPRRVGPHHLAVFRRFAMKAANTTPEIRTWLAKRALENARDKELQTIVNQLAGLAPDRPSDSKLLLADYLKSGDRLVLNELRFWRTTEVLELVDRRLADKPAPAELSLVLRLLSGYETRHRGVVTDVVLKHWLTLARFNYDEAVEVLTSYAIPGQILRQRAIDVLKRDLNGAHADAARSGLERLLQR